uniref:TNFR-Cys domain-containing protein n=1 Tax=Oryzias latipes TaxID=8090 RepID=A0A3B3IJ91_ORYLA
MANIHISTDLQAPFNTIQVVYVIHYCDDSCLTCSGPDDDACTSCRDDWKLDGRSRCTPSVSKCSSHQYSDGDGKCHSCHKYCHKCWGPGKDHCLSCSQRHLLLNGSCVDECPAGYFKEESGQKTCEKCDPSCSECMEGGDEDCLSCSPGLVYLRTEGRCLPSCPPGYHRDSAHQTCEPCHSSCKTCSGETICSDIHQVLCAVAENTESSGLQYTCEDCDSSCLECRAAGPFNCTACPEQAILEEGGRCLPCCQHDDDDDDDDGGEDATAQHDCCNCTESRGQPRSHSV